MKKVILISVVLLMSTIVAQNNFNKAYLPFQVRICEPGEDYAQPQMEIYNSNESYFIYDEVCLINKDIKSTEVVNSMDGPSVFVKLTDEGKEKFLKCTENNVGLNAAIIVDSILVSAPVIQAKIDSGQLIITGNFSEEEADNIAKGICIREKVK